CLLGLLPVVAHAQQAERIFYSSFRPEGWDIWITRDMGATMEHVTDHPALDYDAIITPDGGHVVFTSERSGMPQLYIQSLTDTTVDARLLISSHSMQDQAAIAPDGSRIVFVSTHEGNAD